MTCNILVVDSDASTHEALGEALECEPYELFSAASPDEGMELLRRVDMDLIIAGRHLPGMSGEELLQQMSVEGNRAPGLLIAPASGLGEGSPPHSFPIISKPRNNEELKLLVRYLLEAERLGRENTRLRAQLRVQHAHINCLREILTYLGTNHPVP